MEMMTVSVTILLMAGRIVGRDFHIVVVTSKGKHSLTLFQTGARNRPCGQGSCLQAALYQQFPSILLCITSVDLMCKCVS